MTDRTSAWVRWPGYIAWVFLALLPVSVLMVRSGNWQQGLMLYALGGLLSLLLLAFMAVQAQDVPPIHDISTDVQDPPRFEAVQSLRDSSSNSLEIDPAVIEQQLAAYPDLTTIESPRSYANSYNLALTTARALDWDVVREDSNSGYIEAVARTPIMQFKDDVVIRVRTNAEGSLVDLRSASRVGISDLGANAKRIRAFIAAFRDAAEG